MNVMKAHNKIMKIKAIIDKKKISCGEDIWQRDEIKSNALEILEEICDVAGYYKEEE